MKSFKARLFLDSFINYERQGLPQKTQSFSLQSIKEILKVLDNPQKKFLSIHVAGTKGKGSTCAFTAYILRELGLKVGLYTSPHLSDYTERIRILSPNEKSKQRKNVFEGSITEKQLDKIAYKFFCKIKKTNLKKKQERFTFFEVYTALAFYFFAQEKVDVVVLETGLGGRLDATNIVDAKVCGITSISREHTKQLGSTLAKIAGEKAAIIKKETKSVVVAPQDKKVFDVIANRAKKQNVKMLSAPNDFSCKVLDAGPSGQKFELRGFNNKSYIFKTSILGKYQAVNASTAVMMVKGLFQLISKKDEDSIVRGVKNTVWPARFEIIKKNPYIIIDSAHNKNSAKNLAETIRAIFPKQKIILICAVSKDKDTRGICAELNNIAKDIILTKANHPRAEFFSLEKGRRLFPRKKISVIGNSKEALSLALKKAKKKDIILVAGSVFIAGEIRKCIKKA